MASVADLDLTLYQVPQTSPVVQLICKTAFDNLTDSEKRYAALVASACWRGALICTLQTSPESPYIFAMFRHAFDGACFKTSNWAPFNHDGVSSDAYEQAMAYIGAFFANLGNYKSFGDTKIIPECSPKELLQVLLGAAKLSQSEERVLALWQRVEKAMYSLEPRLRALGFGPTDGLSTYFSSNCTKEDAAICQKFLDSNSISAYNTRLFKTIDPDSKAVTYTIRVAASDKSVDEPVEFEGFHFVIMRGDYSPIMQRTAGLLRAAAEAGANETQTKMNNLYADCFESGDLNKHIDGSREWIKDKGPAVESYIGFIESYQDPAGSRGEWEGFVAVVNREMSRKFQQLVDSAESLLPLLPWPTNFEKDQFQRPDFTSLEVLAFGSSGIPAGINIPNYNSVRQTDGFKNVSLGNVLASAYKPKGADEPVTFLHKSDVKLYSELVTEAFEVQVGLHELLGHGSGKMFMGEGSADGIVNPLTGAPVASYYKAGETYDSVFGSMGGSSFEECRAELVGMHLSPNPSALAVFGHVGKKALDITYINWLHMARAGILGLLFWSPETGRWGQAHMQARFAILQCMLEAGDGFVTIEKDEDGNSYVKMDRTKISTVGAKAIAGFLQRVQVYKATADVAAASAMYEKYTSVSATFRELRAEVVARREPRKMFVQPNLMFSEATNTVSLEEYDPTFSGIVRSFCARYRLDEVEDLVDLAEKEQAAHADYVY